MAKILVADDNEDFLELICDVLESDDHDVVTAKNGREAIKLLDQNISYDLVITDLLMPDIDGIGVIQFVNKMDKKPPIIALSGGGVTINSSDILKVVEDSVQVVLQKPIAITALIEKVNIYI